YENPFTDVALTATFSAPDAESVFVTGFADAADGTIFRLRFSPEIGGVDYQYEIRLSGAGLEKVFQGALRSEPSSHPGPVIVSPVRPKHVIYAGSREPFYHMGYTAYHLLDPSNDDAQIDAMLDYCVEHGFNKIRLLLTGYPRDTEHGTSTDVEHGVPAAA